MDKLSDLIKGRLDRHCLSASAKSAEVLYKANSLLAEMFGKKKPCAKAYRFSNGILFIAAENSVWSQEVWGVQESLLSSLKKCFGERSVIKIIIKSLTIS